MDHTSAWTKARQQTDQNKELWTKNLTIMLLFYKFTTLRLELKDQGS